MWNYSEFLAIFLGGAAGIWKGVGIGLLLNSSPFIIGSYTALGALCSVIILYFAGDKFRKWIVKTVGEKRLERKKGKFQKWLQKYGPSGLGLLATGPLGPFVPLILGMMLIKDLQRFFVFLLIGIVIWSYILAYFSTTILQFISPMWTS